MVQLQIFCMSQALFLIYSDVFIGVGSYGSNWYSIGSGLFAAKPLVERICK